METEKKIIELFYNSIIPSNWQVKTLGQIAKVTSGGTPSRENKSYWGGNIPWITTSLINFNEIENAEEFITEEGLNNSSTKLFPKGTLIMALYGQGITRGKTAILKIDATTNQACAAILLDENNADRNFIFQYLISKYDDIRKLSNTGNQENLNGELVKSIRLNIPPLSEQRAIAQVLNTADAAIQITEKLIAQKVLRKKWLMQQLLAGKKRLKGFDVEWKKCTANDFLSQRNEQAPNNGNIPLFSLTIENGVTEKSDRYEREFLVKDKSIKNYKIVYPNDIVFNPANLRWGAIAKHTRSFKVLLSPIYEVLTVKKEFDIDFISYLVSSQRQINYYASILEGTLIERMAVKVEPFLATKYEIPPKEEQIAIAQVLQAANKEISLLKAKAEKLREQKKGLMQQLLTGKIRLKL
jgi:type I restriction enzyme S subunit